MTKKVAIWVPYLKEQGFGHFYRTLGIYERLEDRSFYFFNGLASPPVSVKYESIVSTNPEEIEHFLISKNVSTLYIDNYVISDDMLKYFSNSKLKVVYFDNSLTETRFSAVVNSNPYAFSSKHPKSFLGTKYYFFRKELSNLKTSSSSRERVFICFGGSDVKKITISVAKFLDSNLEYLVVLGPGCNDEYVKQVQLEYSKNNLKFNIYHNPKNYFELLSSCQNAILTSSTSSYEADYLGLRYICFEVAADQSELARLLKSKNVSVLTLDSIDQFKTAKFNRVGFDFNESNNDLIKFLI